MFDPRPYWVLKPPWERATWAVASLLSPAGLRACQTAPRHEGGFQRRRPLVVRGRGFVAARVKERALVAAQRQPGAGK
jgi:hypothetical protein